MMEDLSLHVLDIAENSIEANAHRVAIRVEERPSRDLLVLEITDDGRGMSPGLLSRALDPFVTTKRTKRIGLGLPLLAQAARATGGKVTLRSRPGRGTKVRATFRLSHIDLQPLGDMAETLTVLMVGHPDVHFRYTHKTDEGSYVFSTSSGEASPAGLQAIAGIKKDIRGGIAHIRRKPSWKTRFRKSLPSTKPIRAR
jgi:anti-sigma regulatory factor (Ser/Thr protein kinase)